MNIKISLSSIMMATFCSWLLAGLLYLTGKRKRVVKGYGIYCIVLLYLFSIARIFLPLDFPFTKAVLLEGRFSKLCWLLRYGCYPTGKKGFSILALFCAIWFGVAAVRLIRFVQNYRDICHMVSLMAKREDAQCKAVLQNVFETAGKARKVTVLYNKGISMPMCMGIMNWRILLPDQNYTDAELYYVLIHEYTHLLNGDLKIKMITNLFCCIFWWNPVVSLLEKGLECSLEKRCDLCATKTFSTNEIISYLETIVKAIKSCGKSKNSRMMDGTVSLGVSEKGEILDRFRFVADSQMERKNHKWKLVLLTAVFTVIWLASYSMIPLPAYDPPIEEIITGPGVYEVTPDNAFVFYKNGKYFLEVEAKNGEDHLFEISEREKDFYTSSNFEYKENVK